VVEIVDDELLLLTPAISFNPDAFTETFTEVKALEEITLEPLHVCLNEEPEFEFYNDDQTGYYVTKDHDVTGNGDVTSDNVTGEYDVTKGNTSAGSSSSDLPPEPPPRDYSQHDLNTSCSEEIYEEPVIPYGSPVYERHPSLRHSEWSSDGDPNIFESDVAKS
jgi:hypothetical protein